MSQFGPNYKWVKSICKACDNNRMKRLHGAARGDANRELHLYQGRLLGEMWYLEVVKKFRASMKMPDLEVSSKSARRRWGFQTEVTGPSICRNAQLPEDAQELWPLAYREKVVKAMPAQKEFWPAQYGVYYKFECDQAVPGPEDGGSMMQFFEKHLNPDNINIEVIKVDQPPAE